MKKIKIGLYGLNGHQIHSRLVAHPHAELVAVAALPREQLPEALRNEPQIAHYNQLEELLANREVQLISLCSPRRIEQAAEAVRCLKAGKHVYAEKPCAMSESALDEILQVSRETGFHFREMAGTAFDQPYAAMRDVVASGRIGEVVQIAAEKSYPYYEGRPQDEAVDGGLIEQNAVHAFRFIEHVAGVKIKSVQAAETELGNPGSGGLRMAASVLVTLENGGLASVVANYLNPRGTGVWGNETLRIWGTRGMIESMRGGQITRLVVGDQDLGPLEVGVKPSGQFDRYMDFLLNGHPMPLSVEEEMSPTRWVIRAKRGAVLV